MLFDFRLLHSFCKQCFQQSFSQRLVQEWWSTIILSISLSPFFKKGIPLLPWVCHEKKGTNTKENVSIKVFNSLSSVWCAQELPLSIKSALKGSIKMESIDYWWIERRDIVRKKPEIWPWWDSHKNPYRKHLNCRWFFFGGKGSLSARVWVYQLIPNNNRNIKD